jgi:hypothetical protein
VDDNAHGLVEDGLEPLLGERAALHVLALELLLYDLTCRLLHDGSLFGVLLDQEVLIAQVDLVADKDLGDVADVLLQLGIPLRGESSTFLRAFSKDEGSITEKTMRKMSQLG